MWMTVISTTAAMCTAVRWRHSPTISAEHWPGSTSHRGFGQSPSSEDEYLSRLRAGAAYRCCCTGPCGAAHDRGATLDIPRRWKAGRNDDSDSDGAPGGVGHPCG